jgi:1-acyl-sn-glycerol-3-phosphate acyltransferase
VAAARGRRPFVFSRVVLGISLYFVCEAGGIVASTLIWLARLGAKQERFIDWNYALQGIWAQALFRGAARIFALRFEVDGEDEIGQGPLILFMRHASTIDTLLPAAFLTRRRTVRLRYVMKQELLWDPCLDIVGQRLPNVFVRRGSGRRDREVGRMRKLAENVGRGEGPTGSPCTFHRPATRWLPSTGQTKEAEGRKWARNRSKDG